ncbi:taspase, threonine aspartase, 1 [Terramyces sp. JEL0728]|nr:taspase, threonine aspartase, 1 [Terramyces sp. JEL0728]
MELMNDICLKSMEFLKKGNSALDTLEYTIGLLELSESTNAGIAGSNFCITGTIECDASLMTLDGYASVGAVPMTESKGTEIHSSPISIAHQLYKNLVKGVDVAGRQPPVMLAGQEAHAFAAEQGMEMISSVAAQQLITKAQWKRYDSHMAILEKAKKKKTNAEYLQDTVGAIIIDATGVMATGVSSGGISLKVPGRIGEAAYPGSGIWIVEESDSTVACTLSGTGEQIMKTMLATTLTNSLASSSDLAGDMEKILVEKFLDSRVLANEQIEKNVGALVVRKTGDNIECWWGHTTPSFCLAFIADNTKPVFRMSRKYSGRLVSVGGNFM